MSLPLIGLVGRKGAGKSTLAQIMVLYFGYEEKAWATALKRELFHTLGQAVLVQEQRSRGMSGYSPMFLDWTDFIDEHKNAAPDGLYGWVRPLLQWYGCEFRRKQDPDYWVKRVSLGPAIVVSDCRFDNEVAAVRRAGGVVWRVLRPGLGPEPGEHESESNADRLGYDATIVNDATRVDLSLAAQVLLDTYGVPMVLP